jgi:hypothetical protein
MNLPDRYNGGVDIIYGGKGISNEGFPSLEIYIELYSNGGKAPYRFPYNQIHLH